MTGGVGGYEELVAAATAVTFDGWDWSALAGRYREGEPSWDYRDLVHRQRQGVESMLDLGTGGGELLAALARQAPLPPRTAATEGYPPNLPLARRRLAPLGVTVHDFSPERYDARLRELHTTLSAGRPLAVTTHRFLLLAQHR